MKLRWYGHSCFLLTSTDGVRILTDPCDPPTGYKLHDIEADAVTVSHAHHDHNYLAAAAGQPAVIDSAGTFDVRGCRVTGVPTWHDREQGKKRGPNFVFVFEIDGLRVAHLGDLGEAPDAAAVAAIGRVDVLLCPIGGYYTIDADEARKTANLLGPRVFIPMHYRTKACTIDVLAPIEPLIHNAVDCNIHRVNGSDVTLTPASLGEDRILVLDYVKM